MNLDSFKCLACQQYFDNKGHLYGHLETHPSHKRQRKQPQKRRVHAQIKSKSVADSGNTVETTDETGQIMGRDEDTSIQFGWSRLTTAQDGHVRRSVPDMCHSLEMLRNSQYRLEPLARKMMEERQRCHNCRRKRTEKFCILHASRCPSRSKRSGPAPRGCMTRTGGCQTWPEHTHAAVEPDDFETNPDGSAASLSGTRAPGRVAVVVDCEMVEIDGGSSELAQLSVVDLLTAEVLINQLVQPTARVTNWRTRYSGITPNKMKHAVKTKAALEGWPAARRELWKYVDRHTVLVGHALQHDLMALHLIHQRIIDTSIVTRMAVGPACRRSWALKVLCKELVGRVIQDGGPRGHDCLEDTFATREIFLKCVLQPQELTRWAATKRVEEQVRAQVRHVAKSWRASRLMARPDGHEASDDDQPESSASERLRWSDVAEDYGWPHPDTGYDPWSD